MDYLSIKIAGPAGMGIKSGGLLISTYFQKLGYFFIDYSEYPSLVRGGHNTYQTTYSVKPISSVNKYVDIFFSFSPNHWQVHQSEFTSKTLVFKNLPKSQHPNIFCFGAIVCLLGSDAKLAKSLLKKTYPDYYAGNLVDFNSGFNFVASNYSGFIGKFLPKPTGSISKNQIIVDGNQAFSHGFYHGGGKFYAAYPMTPSSGALHELAKNQTKWGIKVVHPEDEIAASSMAIGASYAGLPSAVGTSGGGFALMTETISLSAMAEVGVLFYLVSRPGPATGLPTWTSQADLLFATFSGHGDFPKVVIAPADQHQSYHLSQKALEIASKLSMPVIFLSDKHIAESSTGLIDPSKLPVNKLDHPTPKTANSYEHDPDGLSTEDSQIITKMANARLKKYIQIQKLAPKPVFINKSGKSLLISWGSPVGAIRQAFDLGLQGYDLLQIITLWPLDQKIRAITKKYKNIICLENNQFGHLNFLLKTIGVNTNRLITKYDGRPFFPEEIIKSLKIEN